MSARARYRPWFKARAEFLPGLRPGEFVEVSMSLESLSHMTDRMGRAAGVAYFMAPQPVPGFFAVPSDPEACRKALMGSEP